MKMSLPEYIDAANQSTLVIVQIESVEGVARADEIAAVEGVDCVFVGLSDLSVRLGVPGDMKAPKLLTRWKRSGRHVIVTARRWEYRWEASRWRRPIARARGPLHCHRRCRSAGQAGCARFIEEVARSIS